MGDLACFYGESQHIYILQSETPNFFRIVYVQIFLNNCLVIRYEFDYIRFYFIYLFIGARNFFFNYIINSQLHDVGCFAHRVRAEGLR